MRIYVYTRGFGTPTANQHNILTRKTSHKLFVCSGWGFIEPRVLGSRVDALPATPSHQPNHSRQNPSGQPYPPPSPSFSYSGQNPPPPPPPPHSRVVRYCPHWLRFYWQGFCLLGYCPAPRLSSFPVAIRRHKLNSERNKRRSKCKTARWSSHMDVFEVKVT